MATTSNYLQALLVSEAENLSGQPELLDILSLL